MKFFQFPQTGYSRRGRGGTNPLVTLLACVLITFMMMVPDPAPLRDRSVLRAAALRDEATDGSRGSGPQESSFEAAAGPDIVVSPDRFDLSVIAGRRENETLEIRNVGSESLSFKVTVSHGARSHWQPLVFPAEKVEPGLRERLSTSGETTLLVYMEEQADLSAAFLIGDWDARGRYVYDALRAVARSSQESLVELLLVELQAGRISSFEPFYLVNAVAVKGSLSALDTLATYPGVAYIEALGTYRIPEPEPGASSPAPAALAWGVDQIDAERVWNELGFRGDGVVVANIDTGVMYEHDALHHQYRGTATGSHDYNWFDPRGADAPFDNHGHGTHVMGTMVGDDLSGNQIGVAPEAQWIAAKGCASFSCTEEDLLKSAEWILAPYPIVGAPDQGDPSKRPNVVNNSWGGPGGSLWYQQAVKNWRAAAIFPAFAGGNSGPRSGSVTSPGDYAESFASGATDSTDSIADFSSRGPSSVTDETKPDVSAPGVSIRSSWTDGGYRTASGTSMASPHSAGCVALMVSARPSTDLAQLEDALMATAVDLGESGPDHTYGHGRIDCFAAVSEVIAPAAWLSVQPTSGSVEPGESNSLDVNVDATNLRPGRYGATIRIESNDPDEGIVEVPVDLQVRESDAPVVTIKEPPDGSSFQKGESVTFSGSATDAEDGDLSSKLSWSSDRDGKIGSGASFTTSSLSAGTHAVTASVTDSDGVSGEDSISITIKASQNTPPTVSIIEPADGSSFEKAKPVTFSGRASDGEDGDLTSQLSWTSSLDGRIGSGGSFTTSSLSAGTHAITASATDSDGASGEDVVSITITPAQNTPPNVTITAPPNGSSFQQGEPVTFSGTATDKEDGNLSAKLGWSSNRDGVIGSGGSFTTSSLSAGTHTVTAKVADSGGLSASTAVSITITPVQNTPPRVDITAPESGSSFSKGAPVTFSGTATDEEDGDLTAKLEWYSDRDGSIGSGGTFTTSSLSVGTHYVYAWATDSGGLTGWDWIFIGITDTNSPPTVGITAPPNGSSFQQGAPVTFSGTATDKEDGDLTAKLLWSSNRDGSIGAGGSFTTSSLSVGAHTVTAKVTDSGGLSASTAVSISVTPVNTPPTVAITAPPNGSSFEQGAPVTFSGTATDKEDGDLAAKLLWSSNRDGSIGSGGSFTTSSLSVGAHTVTASATDSGNLSGSASISVTITSTENQRPEVTITAPPHMSTFTQGEPVTFSGSAIDAEDGNLTWRLLWFSTIDMTFGVGGEFTTSSLSVGRHWIFAHVTDSAGTQSFDWIIITITPATEGGGLSMASAEDQQTSEKIRPGTSRSSVDRARGAPPWDRPRSAFWRSSR